LSKFTALKKTVFSLLFLCFCLTQASYAQQHKVIAIGFYNVENFFDTIDDPTKDDIENTPTPAIYAEKLTNMASVFQKMGTDVTPDGPAVIGIAEIENDNVLKAVTAQPEIKSRGYKYVWFPTPDVRGISTALLYNPRMFRLLGAQSVRVPLETLGQSRPTRDILHAYGILAGDTVHFLVNHWPSKSGGEARSAPGRRLAAQVGKHIIDSLQQANPNAKILLMGDLNDNPTSEGVIEVLKAKAKKEGLASTDIYNPWIDMYKSGIGTESYQGEWNLIDQIMITGAFVNNPNNKWKYYKHQIFNKEFLTNRLGKDKGLPKRSYTINHVWNDGYSDHFPVLMYFIEKAN